MKKMLLVMMLGLSLQLQAAGFSLTYFGNESGRQVFYACSYVEEQTYFFLDMLGARDVDVFCSGGIRPGWYAGPIHLRVNFENPVVSGDRVERVVLSGDPFNPGCGLNTNIIREILKQMPHIKVVSKNDFCPFVDSNFFYQLDVPN